MNADFKQLLSTFKFRRKETWDEGIQAEYETLLSFHGGRLLFRLELRSCQNGSKYVELSFRERGGAWFWPIYHASPTSFTRELTGEHIPLLVQMVGFLHAFGMDLKGEIANPDGPDWPVELTPLPHPHLIACGKAPKPSAD